MDGYKKTVLTGSALLLAGYFLPWFSGMTGSTSGLNALLLGLDTVRAMQALGQYEYAALAGYAALALPALGALLSLFYCLIRPGGGNGSFGSILFLLPLCSLALSALYLAATQFGIAPGGTLAAPFINSVLDSAPNLAATGGLWLVLLGALLMALGKISR